VTPPRTLDDWLAHCERLHPVTIDLTLDRVRRVRERLGLDLSVPIFTVGGTNGKGSTCAMLESILLQAGYRVAVYTSPHLIHFEERLRLNGAVVQAELLLPHFEAVEAARGDVQLTYFEFTTLALLRCVAAQPLDAVVLEVGLGGRLDAVNAFDTDCAVVTSIGIDHVAYLGPDRESIGREKAGIMRAGKPAIVGDPSPPASLVNHAREIGADLRQFGSDFDYIGDRQQWNWRGRERRHNALAYPALRGANQLINASGVLAALEAMHARLPVPAQAVRTGLALVQLAGRFQILPGQPAVVLDVGHNPHAAASLAVNLDQMGYYPRTHAVFGLMADKDLAGVVAPLLPVVDAWHCTDLPIARAAKAEVLAGAVRTAQAQRDPAVRPVIHCHGDPAAALATVLEQADPTDRILVFGSHHTVGGVMQQGLPRLGVPGSAPVPAGAAHVGR
jgi:dihydrofolate synthase/folylpolyglutamate synthase